ncbi:MAG TPA: NUDIX domain-containing protein [Longimicrobium sp.]|nr:NUDIX domain-containing protein [Longimicrobium sp.]
MLHQDAFLAEVAARGAIRVSVRSICIHGGALLVQRPADDPAACYAFIGGGLETGERMEDRIRQEYREELGREVVRARYRFVVENRFRTSGGIVHSLEHYFSVELDSHDVRSREHHLVQSWLPLDQLPASDVRPRVVRDAIIDGSWETVRHLVVPLA